MNTTNKEPVVSIKMTLSELQLLNKIVDAHICDLDEMYKDDTYRTENTKWNGHKIS